MGARPDEEGGCPGRHEGPLFMGPGPVPRAGAQGPMKWGPLRARCRGASQGPMNKGGDQGPMKRGPPPRGGEPGLEEEGCVGGRGVCWMKRGVLDEEVG